MKIEFVIDLMPAKMLGWRVRTEWSVQGSFGSFAAEE
jgi:hypothetical protein